MKVWLTDRKRRQTGSVISALKFAEESSMEIVIAM